jgi:hypothetical protein
MPTDDWGRADGGPGGNWTPTAFTDLGANTPQIASGQLVQHSSGPGFIWWNADAFDDAQYAEITLADVDGGVDQGVGVLTRAFEDTGPAMSGYAFHGKNDYGVIRGFVSGSGGIIANPGWSAVDGDVLRGESEGNDHRIYLNDVEEGSVSDASVASGSAGVSCVCFGSNANKMDDWEGGNLFVPPLVLPYLGLFDADLNSLALFDTDLAWSRIEGVGQLLVQYARDFQQYGKWFFRHKLLRMVGARELLEALPRIGSSLRGPLIHAIKRSTRAWSCRKPNTRHGRGWHVKRCRDLWLALGSWSPNLSTGVS